MDGTVWTDSDILIKLFTASDGDDVIYGGIGDDVINGLGGADTIYGRTGDDVSGWG